MNTTKKASTAIRPEKLELAIAIIPFLLILSMIADAIWR